MDTSYSAQVVGVVALTGGVFLAGLLVSVVLAIVSEWRNRTRF